MLLIDYIRTHRTIKLQTTAHDWREAVKLGTDMIEGVGHVTSEYYEEIIRQTEKIGPYFVLAPGLAMPHARPECGVIESSWALVTLSSPVEFHSKENDPVDIIITMASKSSKEQNEIAIVQVVEIFDTPELVDAIRKSHTIEQLMHAFDTLYTAPEM